MFPASEIFKNQLLYCLGRWGAGALRHLCQPELADNPQAINLNPAQFPALDTFPGRQIGDKSTAIAGGDGTTYRFVASQSRQHMQCLWITTGFEQGIIQALPSSRTRFTNHQSQLKNLLDTDCSHLTQGMIGTDNQNQFIRHNRGVTVMIIFNSTSYQT